MAAQSPCCVVCRGLSEFQVWMGFAVTGGWCVVLFVIALRSLRVAK